ncbi:SdiA-regulated domain-containing protein [Roseivirga sp.]|uniref:SdiA-regulated domain-containing protein n=1 Tax=Roseivirga sp. TaxID=1964215 RepID=UPI003B8E03CC
MKKTFKTFFILFLLSNSFGLVSQEQNKLAYDIDNPDERYVLPEYLEEVSALTFYQKDQLAMLNDEKGRMYVLDLNTKKIVHRVRFEGNGDFEGLERVGDYIYAIESNGKLYRFNVKMEGVVEKIKTPFDSGNNVEGLGYDAQTGHLLFALKEDGDIKDVSVKGKAIYGFHLETEKFKKTPIHIVKHKDLKRVLGDKYKFKPSGVAVHPLTREVYIIAAAGQSLLVCSPEGEPLHLSKLKSTIFPQPEGIAFAPNGDMFISSEVDGEGGVVLKFKAN